MDNDLFLDLIGQALSEKLPDLAVTALNKIETDNPLVDAMLDHAVIPWVAEHGPDGVEGLLAQLASAVKPKGKKGLDLMSLPSLDAAALTALADAYQTAEAEERKAAKLWLVKTGQLLGKFAEMAYVAIRKGFL